MGFKLKAADGTPLEIQDGEYYFNTKARGRRMMGNSLSSDARRVYACLELATMGFQQELAVTMEAGKIRPLSPSDICQQTKLTKQSVRRAFEELEDQGLAKREADDGNALRRGHLRLYSWAEPHPTRPKIKEVVARGYFPEWFPESWEPLRPLISRFKYSLIADEVAARDYFEEGAEVARAYQNAEEVAARFLERVRADNKKPRASLYGKNGKNIERKAAAAGVSSPAPPPVSPPPAPIEEHVAQELSIDDDAAQRLVAGCKEVAPSITGPEIVGLARAKIHAARDQIRTGKIANATGLLIKHVPKMCVGPSLQAIREQLEAENKERALRISYAREAWDDLNEDERELVLQKYPELRIGVR